MLKIYFIILLLISNIYAKEYSFTYNGSIDIYGDTGKSEIFLSIKKSTYVFNVKSYTTGALKIIKNKKTIYKSKGIIKNSIFLPTMYTEIIFKNNNLLSKIEFIINHKLKIIYKRIYNPKTNQLISQNEIKYIKNDMLSYYLNFRLNNYKGKVKYINQKRHFTILNKNTIIKNNKNDNNNIYLIFNKNKLFFSEAKIENAKLFLNAYLKKI